MADPLAQFRKNPGLSLTEKDPSSDEFVDDGQYHAFHAVDRDPRALSVRSGIAWVHESYAFLQYVTEDAGRGRRFCIVYGFMVVDVKGRNLRPVVEAIHRGNCAFIQEFDAAKWSKPTDTSAPFIESIVFHHGAEKRGEMLGRQKAAETEEV